MNATDAPRVGWVPEPDGRGTAGLLVSCLFTVFLSTWTTYHPDVKGSWSAAVWDKVIITIGSILAPECIVWVALGDWNRSKKLQFLFREIAVEVCCCSFQFEACGNPILMMLNSLLPSGARRELELSLVRQTL